MQLIHRAGLATPAIDQASRSRDRVCVIAWSTGLITV